MAIPPRLLTALTVTSALSIPAVSLATPAAAVTVSCGETVLTSVVLNSDVGPCPEVGLRTGADNIVIDLNGHSVIGQPRPGAGTVGIFVLNGGVTVKNGSVADFDTGVSVNASDGQLSTLTVRDNIAATSGPSVGLSGRGIFIVGANNTLISDTRDYNNGPEAGIRVFNGAGNVIDRSTIAGNAVGRQGVGSHGEPLGQNDTGILIDAATGRGSANGNRITNSSITGNGSDGIRLMQNANSTTIMGNDISSNGSGGAGAPPGHIVGQRFGGGVYGLSNFNVIERNRIIANTSNGVLFDRGLSGFAGTNNRIASNTVVYNGRSVGGGVDLNDANPGCDNNAWIGNRFLTSNQACIH